MVVLEPRVLRLQSEYGKWRSEARAFLDGSSVVRKIRGLGSFLQTSEVRQSVSLSVVRPTEVPSNGSGGVVA